jgi:hypothetical protein
MSTTGKAIRIIRDAEISLRELLSKAAANGEYAAVMQVGEWASDLARIISKATDSTGSKEAAVDPVIGSLPRAALATKGKQRSRATGAGRSHSNSPRYPVFVKEGGNLVKIGWSKSEKAQYEHKAPRRVLTLVASALSKVAAGSRRITMEKVLPLTDRANGSDIPSYQAYLCLAWLRSVGLVTQHGRQGYSIPKGLILEAGVEERWQQLIER